MAAAGGAVLVVEVAAFFFKTTNLFLQVALFLYNLFLALTLLFCTTLFLRLSIRSNLLGIIGDGGSFLVIVMWSRN